MLNGYLHNLLILASWRTKIKCLLCGPLQKKVIPSLDYRLCGWGQVFLNAWTPSWTLEWAVCHPPCFWVYTLKLEQERSDIVSPSQQLSLMLFGSFSLWELSDGFVKGRHASVHSVEHKIASQWLATTKVSFFFTLYLTVFRSHTL